MSAVLPLTGLNLKKLTIVAGLVGLAVFHTATGNYSQALNDVLTIVAATTSGPILDFVESLGVKPPAELTPSVLPVAPASNPPSV